jgi:predicted metalloprotease with PDZ domain
MIKYIIHPKPSTHIYNVSLEFIPSAKQSTLKLPTWIPGSYMIREFGKNIITITAWQDNKAINCEQTNKNTWIVSDYKVNKLVEIRYEVYAFDFGIRTAYLDNKRGYFNNTSLCVYIEGSESLMHTIQINNLPRTWNIATALRTTGNQYLANNYDELIDCPFELGEFTRLFFKVKDTPHFVVLSGTISSNFDSKRFIADITKICETQINLFGGVAPFTSYTFMLYLGGEIYTGLEHRNSTALMAPYYSLPVFHVGQVNDDYLKLLGLISHEYFHLWNVKRIKPQAFNPYDLEQENYTGLLWWFEGITSYYDDLILYRAGLIDRDVYLKVILDNINNVYKFDGVNKQSLTNSSLTAWTKYYRQDENSPNSLVSYYVKGSLVGLCLDLLIRSQTKKSLDDVLLGLYNKWQQGGEGLLEDELPSLIKQYTRCDLTAQITDFTSSYGELPLVQLLNYYGILLEKIPARYSDSGKILEKDDKLPQNSKVSLGIKTVKEPLGYRVTNVYTNSSEELLGLAVNDLLLAIDRVKLTDLDRQFGLYRIDDQVTFTLFRQEQLLDITVKLEGAMTAVYYLKIINEKKLGKWL